MYSPVPVLLVSQIHMPGSSDQFLRNGDTNHSKLRQMQMKGWNLLNSPHSSLSAQVRKVYLPFGLSFRPSQIRPEVIQSG